MFLDPTGARYGLPTFPLRMAPAGLATRRQLTARGLRPGGQQPVAQLMYRRYRRTCVAALYDIAHAVPKRAPSPRLLASLDRAMAARRTCPTCHQLRGYCIPLSLGECLDCAESWAARTAAARRSASDGGVVLAGAVAPGGLALAQLPAGLSPGATALIVMVGIAVLSVRWRRLALLAAALLVWAMSSGWFSRGSTGGPLALGAPVPAAYRSLVNQAGSRCPEVTPALIAAQLSQESGFDAHAASQAGAQGIAQFEPATWQTWGGGGSVWDPAAAIPAQGRFMCALAAAAKRGVAAGQLHGDVTQLALAGYNAGFGSVQAAGGIPAITETENYVSRITALAAAYAAPKAAA